MIMNFQSTVISAAHESMEFSNFHKLLRNKFIGLAAIALLLLPGTAHGDYDNYLTLNIVGPNQVCADGTTVYQYAISGYYGSNTWTWTVTGGTVVNYPGPSQIDVKWTSSTGTLSASLVVENCYERPVFDDSIPPQIIDYETICDTWHYFTNPFTVTSNVAIYLLAKNCTGTETSLTLSGSQSTVSYQLKRDGTNVGAAVSGTGNALTNAAWANLTTAGTYKVVGTLSSCSVDMTNTFRVLAPFTLTASPVCWTGGSATNITLSGSETGVSYQLKINDVDSGLPVTGNGSSLAWNNQTTIGLYTVVASLSGGCPRTMTGAVGPASVGGELTATQEYDKGKGVLTVSGYTGTVNRWEKNTGAGWTTIQNSQPAYSFIATSVNTDYRAIIKSGSCTEQASTVVKIGAQYLSYGDSTLLTSNSGSIYKWLKSGTVISGATQQTYLAKEAALFTVKLTSTEKLGGIFFVLPTLSNAINPVNAVSVSVILKEGVTESTLLYTLKPTEIAQAVSYLDGIGRTFQTVGVRSSPGGYDVVSADLPGRPALNDTSYLPYVTSARSGRYRPYALRWTSNKYDSSEQQSFYVAASMVATDTHPYAVTRSRDTLSTRFTEQGAPGNDWRPGPGTTHTVKSQIAFNNSSYPVRRWKPDGSTPGNYTNGTVVVRLVTDENGNKVRTYTNGLGQTVLKQVEAGVSMWLQTYYVYDDYGRLKYQVPPKAVDALDSSPHLENDTNLAELIYKYTYDNLGRVTVKKVPGAAEEHIVYDKLNRIVLTQDGNQRLQNKWMFIKYDFYSRPVYSGIYASSSTRSTLQTTLDSASVWYETEQVNATTQGYSNSTFPTTGITVLSVNYYDHYDFDRNTTADYSYDNTPLAGQEATAVAKPRGSATGSKRVTINSSGTATSTWLVNVVFYGKYDRAIQTLSNNHLYATVADKTTVIYDFSGKTLLSRTTHQPSATQRERITSRPVYDHSGRVVKQYQTVDNNPVVWSAAVNVSVTGSTITKTTSSATWSAGAFSANGIPASTNGVLQFSASSTTGHKIMGLADTNPDVNYTSIDYAIYTKSGGTLEIWESNVNRGAFGSFVASDVFTIERVGTTIYYKKNGTTFYTSTVASSTALYADCSLYHENASYVGVTLTGTEKLLVQYEYNALGQMVDKKLHSDGSGGFLQSVDYRYNIRGWLRSINNSQLTNDGSLNNDTGDYFGMELLYNKVDSIGNWATFNGNISGAIWKGFGSGNRYENRRSYKYTYDRSERLTEATFQAHTGFTWTKEANTLNETMTYDVNGNINTLVRKRNLRGLAAGPPVSITSTAETMDNLTFTYAAFSPNRHLKIEDAAGITAGFNNQVALNNEYKYDTIGNLIADKNKRIDSVHYNVLGKVRRVKFTNGAVITYTYDAAGMKLKMISTRGAVTRTTDYTGSFVYENGVLSFFSSPEGRVVKNVSGYEYQYAIADHQGNTRALFTSATPVPLAITATFEGNASDNANQFSNVNAANVLTFTAANHTTGGGKVVRLNQGYPVGPSKSIKVYPGDKVDMEVWSYYENSSGFGTGSPTVGTFVTAVASAFGGVSGGGESGSIFSGVSSALWAFLLGGNAGDGAPAAYLNYILYDQSYKVLTMGWKRVPATPFSKQEVKLDQLLIKEAGFVFVYLSYEDLSNNYVQFDDFKVTHTRTSLIQMNEYYPFGLQTANSWTREGAVDNNFLSNGGTELNDSTNWFDLAFRNYDPAIGRMNGVDPLAGRYSSLTPYNYSFNDPVSFTDPSGASPIYEGYTVDRYFNQLGWMQDDVVYQRYVGDDGKISGSFLTGFGLGAPVDWRNETFSGIRTLGEFLSGVLNSRYGGSWSDGNTHFYGSSQEAFDNGVGYNNSHNSWGTGGGTIHSSASGAEKAYKSALDKQLQIKIFSSEQISAAEMSDLLRVPYNQMIAFQGPGDEPGLMESLWNSAFARFLVPDILTLDLNVGSAVGYGRSITMTMNLITRGADAGLHRTGVFSDAYLAEIGYGLNVGYLNYHGPVGTLSHLTLEGPTRTISMGAGVGVNVNFGYQSWDSSPMSPWVSGLSVGIGDTVGASLNVGNTASGWWPFWK